MDPSRSGLAASPKMGSGGGKEGALINKVMLGKTEEEVHGLFKLLIETMCFIRHRNNNKVLGLA